MLIRIRATINKVQQILPCKTPDIERQKFQHMFGQCLAIFTLSPPCFELVNKV